MKKDCTYNSTERYPRSIQVFSTDTQKSSLHPTQKPVALCEYLIKKHNIKNLPEPIEFKYSDTADALRGRFPIGNNSVIIDDIEIILRRLLGVGVYAISMDSNDVHLEI